MSPDPKEKPAKPARLIGDDNEADAWAAAFGAPVEPPTAEEIPDEPPKTPE